MKNSKKYIFILLIVYLILRELLPFNISYYKDYSEWNTTSNSSSNKTSFEAEEAFDESYVINYDRNEKYNVRIIGLNEVPYNENKKENSIVISVHESNNIGLSRFIPLIKRLDISSNSTYNWHTQVYYSGKLYKIGGSGSISTRGNKHIYGICSGKKAKQLIQDVINEKIEIKVREEVNSALSSIQ